MASLPVRAFWIGDKPIEFTDATLDTDLQTMTVQNLDTRLPIGSGEKVTLRVELTNGNVYEGQATTKMPRDIARRGFPTLHVYEFAAKVPLTPAS